MKISNSLVGLLALAASAGVGVCSVAPHYVFNTVDVPVEAGMFTSAYGINNAGVLAGNFFSVDGEIEGFIFQQGLFTIVTGPTGALDAAVNDVNDAGQGVGGFTDSETGIEHSFIRDRNGNITVLPDGAPEVFVSEVTGINNVGTMVGFYLDADFVAHGFILRGGVPTTYDYPGALRTILTRINDRGQIAGIRLDTDGHRRGFVLQNGSVTTIDVPGALNTRTGGINNQGDVVGYYDDASMVSHGFLLTGGMYVTIDFPGATDTALLDINDKGVIAGTYDGFSHGLVATPVK